MGFGEGIRESQLDGEPAGYDDIVAALHCRYSEPRERGRFDELEKLTIFRLLLEDTGGDRVVAFDNLLKNMICHLKSPDDSRTSDGAFQAGAREYAKITGENPAKPADTQALVGKAIYEGGDDSYRSWVDAMSKGKSAETKAISLERSRDYCARFTYLLAGLIAQEEHRLLQRQWEDVPEPSGTDSLLNQEPWQSRIDALDQTLTTLHKLGFTKDVLNPGRVRWSAKSGFIDISTPSSKLIVSQARKAVSIFGVSPWWDHDRDPEEGNEYFQAQLEAMSEGAHIQRVFLYSVSDSEMERLAKDDPEQAILLEPQGRKAAMRRAKDQIDEVLEAAKAGTGATRKWGQLTTWVTHEDEDMRTDAMLATPLLGIALDSYSVPSIAVYTHDGENPHSKCAAAIDREKSSRYLLSAFASDIDQLRDLFVVASSRGHYEASAP